MSENTKQPGNLYETIKDGLHIARDEITYILDCLKPAPTIEGIDPAHQERSLIRLIKLKLKQASGEKLTFEEQKRLTLSDRGRFEQNRAFFEFAKHEIDKDIIPLVRALNSKPYIYTEGNCAGHLQEDDEGNVLFNDTGFISINLDPNDERSARLKKKLEELCAEESEQDGECIYKINYGEPNNNGFRFFLTWKWNHPVYNKERELHASRSTALINKNHDEVAQIESELRGDEFRDAKSDASKKAKELGIHERHMDFVKKTTELIKNFN